MIIQVFKLHDFSMHGTFFSDFQVFHDFQSLWEPCIIKRTCHQTVLHSVTSDVLLKDFFLQTKLQ